MLDMGVSGSKHVANNPSELTAEFIEDNLDEFQAGRLFLTSHYGDDVSATTHAAWSTSKNGLLSSCDAKNLGFTSDAARDALDVMRAQAITEDIINKANIPGYEDVLGGRMTAVREMQLVDAAAFIRDDRSSAASEVAVEGDYNPSLRGASYMLMQDGTMNHLCEVTPYSYEGEEGLIFSIPADSEIDALYPEVRNGLDELTFRGANLSEATLVVPYSGSAYLVSEPWDGTSSRPETEIYGLEQASPFMNYAHDVLQTCSQVPSTLRSPDSNTPSIQLTDEQRKAASDSLEIAQGDIAYSRQARQRAGLTPEQWSDGNFLNQVVLYSEALNHEVAAQGVLDKLAADQKSSHPMMRSALEMEVASAQRVKERIAENNPDVVDVVSKHLSEENKLVDTEWINQVGESKGRVSSKGMVDGGWLNTIKTRLEQVRDFVPKIPNYFKEFNEKNPTWQDKAGALMVGASNAFAVGVNKAFDVTVNVAEKLYDKSVDMKQTYNRYKDIHTSNEERFDRTPEPVVEAKEADAHPIDEASGPIEVEAEILDYPGEMEEPRVKVVQNELPEPATTEYEVDIEA